MVSLTRLWRGFFDPKSPSNPNTPPKHCGDAIKRREIVVDLPIDDEVARQVIAKLLFLNQQAPQVPILFYIDCPGGAITATLAILDTISLITAPVSTSVQGIAAGAGLWLLAAGTPGHRTICEGSALLIVPTVGGVEFGDVQAMWKINDALAKLMAGYSRMSESQVLAYLQSGGEKTFTAEEALVLGIADLVVPRATL